MPGSRTGLPRVLASRHGTCTNCKRLTEILPDRNLCYTCRNLMNCLGGGIMKESCLNYIGGNKCSECGRSDLPAPVMLFDHLKDKSQNGKNRSISDFRGFTITPELAKAYIDEVDLTRLLCPTCHEERKARENEEILIDHLRTLDWTGAVRAVVRVERYVGDVVRREVASRTG